MFVLALLDFSSAFDTIDHPILVHRLHTDFGFTDTVLPWFSSYLTDHKHYVSLSNFCCAFALVHCTLLLYTEIVLRPQFMAQFFSPCILGLCLQLLIHSTINHSSADDLQLHMPAPPDKISELFHSMQSCICDVNTCATANMLKLNDNKTELMLVTSKSSEHLHSLPTSIIFVNAKIPFKHSEKKLGLTLVCHLTMNAHVSKIAPS